MYLRQVKVRDSQGEGMPAETRKLILYSIRSEKLK